MQRKKIGLKDIAREVGVSTALVSYVLNDRMTNRISAEVSARIKETAQRLNYQPNQIAKSLKMQRSHTLGLVVADIANPFSGQIARAIEDEAKKQGYTVIFGSSDDNAQKSRDLIQTMRHRQVDGLIIAAVEQSEDTLVALAETGMPFVLIDRFFPEYPFSYVAIDNQQAAFEAVALLIKNGRKRIGFITYETDLFHMLERERGYLAALEAYGQTGGTEGVRRVPLADIPELIGNYIHDLHAQWPDLDGLVFSTNVLALGGLKHLKKSALRVPDDIAVVAFDTTDYYDLFYVSITHVRQPIDALGRLATEALLAQIKNPTTVIQQSIPATLIVQESSGKTADF